MMRDLYLPLLMLLLFVMGVHGLIVSDDFVPMLIFVLCAVLVTIIWFAFG